jgi:molecular chaperone GrpE
MKDLKEELMNKVDGVTGDKIDPKAATNLDEKGQKQGPTSSDSSSSDENEKANSNTSGLSLDEIKQIRETILEQDKQLDALKEEHKKLKLKLVNEMNEGNATSTRYRKEIDVAREYAITKFAKEIIDVSDNLERANEYIQKVKVGEEDDIESLKKHIKEIALGTEMTSTVMHNILHKFDMTKFEAAGGEKFNPNLHEQVSIVETPSDHPDNTVHKVSEPGWKIGDKVIRKAKVHVVKKK